MKTVEERWEEGIDHDPRAEALARELARIDTEYNDDQHDFKFGGGGDSGEALTYLLDIYFEEQDNKDLLTAAFAKAAATAAKEQTWILNLNKYQRDNLITLLRACGYMNRGVAPFQAANTGDWLGEIHNMLEPGPDPQPNQTLDQLRERVGTRK